MPSQISAERVKAEQMYRESKGTMKLVDIANHLGVTPSKVRKWKSLSNWDDNGSEPQGQKKKRVERSTSTKGSVPQVRKRGAPPGNKNAVGNSGGSGGPVGNKKTEKHGIYANVYWDFLEEDEHDLIQQPSQADEEQILVDNINLLTIRERRLMKKIKQFHDQDEKSQGLMLAEIDRCETKREFESDEDKALYNERQRAKIEKDELLPGHSYRISTRTVNNTELLLKAHAELTRVQEQKRRCVEALHRLRQAGQETKSNSIANDWIEALVGGVVGG